MEVVKEYKIAAAEVIDIIKNMDEYDIDRIPLSIISRLNEIKEKNYIANIDYTKSLEENKLNDNTKAILAYIYSNFLCDQDEKNKYDEMLQINKKKCEEKLIGDYKLNFSNENIIENSKSLVEFESVSKIQKIFHKVKKYLKLIIEYLVMLTIT